MLCYPYNPRLPKKRLEVTSLETKTQLVSNQSIKFSQSKHEPTNFYMLNFTKKNNSGLVFCIRSVIGRTCHKVILIFISLRPQNQFCSEVPVGFPRPRYLSAFLKHKKIIIYRYLPFSYRLRRLGTPKFPKFASDVIFSRPKPNFLQNC